ncbi:peptidase M13 [Patiriisocius marinistellae]|uniref:Peptidase M13 n=1 Tax=Patiriisocius marinistellae TaxID=2494560 RepID=A0A5J4FUW1_9FLAO|nr:M13 family metallopeptidase [Patiriisocius marinistellae]GEQ86457.1 peptidase M13 [Patiriisocius marinistellae]
MKKLPYLIILLLIFISCKESHSHQEEKEAPKVPEFDGISQNIKPGDNFFAHVNKKWNDNAVIADDQVGVGSYMFLNIPQRELLEEILENAAASDNTKGSVEQKLGDFYASGMDTVQINKRGFEPIKPMLDEINKINDVKSLMQLVSEEQKNGHTSLIGLYISADQENSKFNIMHAAQSGLGLPDRDYYFGKDEETVAIQEAYKTYLTTLFKLVNEPNAEQNALTVYSIEKQLANEHKTRVERRKIEGNYNKFSLAQIVKMQPNLNWESQFNTLGVQVDSVDMKQPAYYNALDKMLTKISLNDWKLYLKASVISNYADYLSTPFEEASFEYSKALTGQSKKQTREQAMVRQVDGLLGFALGQLYTKQHFDEAAKKRALELVNNFQKAFEARMDNLDWMSDSTKVKAKEKLYAITKKIGYPDVWREYDVEINKDQYFENIITLERNDFDYMAAQLNKAPDKDRWGTTPSTVTAYYNASLNEIVFPAGILQFPYFDVNADDAVNYGGIGMVIGHEFTHAFDDRGAQYDKEGNVKNWWTDDDLKNFKAKTQQIIDRYSEFTVLDDVHVNGATTVGENVADNGGISIAYDAFKLTKQGQDTIKIGGYTPDQRFFMSIARIWRVKTRDAFLRTYINTNSHSPAIWRVNGPLMNSTPFYEAFDVKPGDSNYKAVEERIKIW